MNALWNGLLLNLQATFRYLEPSEIDSIVSRYRYYEANLPSLRVVWADVNGRLEREFVNFMEANVFDASE